jgi:hypothetical protein
MRHKKAKNYRRTMLRLPDLDHSKLAVLNSLTTSSSRRVYQYAMEQFIAWYCSVTMITASYCSRCSSGVFTMPRLYLRPRSTYESMRTIQLPVRKNSEAPT